MQNATLAAQLAEERRDAQLRNREIQALKLRLHVARVELSAVRRVATPTTQRPLLEVDGDETLGESDTASAVDVLTSASPSSAATPRSGRHNARLLVDPEFGVDVPTIEHSCSPTLPSSPDDDVPTGISSSSGTTPSDDSSPPSIVSPSRQVAIKDNGDDSTSTLDRRHSSRYTTRLPQTLSPEIERAHPHSPEVAVGETAEPGLPRRRLHRAWEHPSRKERKSDGSQAAAGVRGATQHVTLQSPERSREICEGRLKGGTSEGTDQGCRHGSAFAAIVPRGDAGSTQTHSHSHRSETDETDSNETLSHRRRRRRRSSLMLMEPGALAEPSLSSRLDPTSRHVFGNETSSQ